MTAAHRSDAQREAQLERDLIRVLRENVERARPDVAETNNSNVNWLHRGERFFLFDH